jgi:hypothetical protein
MKSRALMVNVAPLLLGMINTCISSKTKDGNIFFNNTINYLYIMKLQLFIQNQHAAIFIHTKSTYFHIKLRFDNY